MENKKFNDYMGCSSNPEIINQLDVSKGEKIVYSCSVSKFNKWGIKQERTLMLTNTSLYNIKKNTSQRKISIFNIKAVTKSTQPNNKQFIVHINSEYDYMFESDQISEIFEAIKLVFWQNKKINLPVFGVPDKLKDYSTSKKDINNGVEVKPKENYRLVNEDIYEELGSPSASTGSSSVGGFTDEVSQFNDEVQQSVSQNVFAKHKETACL